MLADYEKNTTQSAVEDQLKKILHFKAEPPFYSILISVMAKDIVSIRTQNVIYYRMLQEQLQLSDTHTKFENLKKSLFDFLEVCRQEIPHFSSEEIIQESLTEEINKVRKSYRQIKSYIINTDNAETLFYETHSGLTQTSIHQGNQFREKQITFYKSGKLRLSLAPIVQDSKNKTKSSEISATQSLTNAFLNNQDANDVIENIVKKHKISLQFVITEAFEYCDPKALPVFLIKLGESFTFSSNDISVLHTKHKSYENSTPALKNAVTFLLQKNHIDKVATAPTSPTATSPIAHEEKPAAPPSKIIFFAPPTLPRAFRTKAEEGDDSLSILNVNPCNKFLYFLDETLITTTDIHHAILLEARCHALTLLCIQYLENHIKTKAAVKLLTTEEARWLRNALVHQMKVTENNTVGFVTDGMQKQLLSFADALYHVIKTMDASNLKKNPFFNTLVAHGKMLEEEKASGEREYKRLSFGQRLIYTHFLGKTLSSFQDIQFKIKSPIMQHMVAHAIEMIKILYCLYHAKEASDTQRLTDEDYANAIQLRHQAYSVKRKP